MSTGFNTANPYLKATNPEEYARRTYATQVAQDNASRASDEAYDHASGGPQKRALADLQKQQIAQATAFRGNLGSMQNQNAQMLKSQSNQQMKGALDSSRQVAAHRGMSYGGMQQGQEGAIRANAGTQLSGAVANSNAGLLDAANTMDRQAIGTATGAQQSQQAMQNMAYSQAQAQLQGQNALYSGLMQTGLLYALL